LYGENQQLSTRTKMACPLQVWHKSNHHIAVYSERTSESLKELAIQKCIEVVLV